MADEQHEDDPDVRDCAVCGGVMEKQTQATALGGFGSTGMSVVSTSAYYVCPNCGDDTGPTTR